MSTTITCPACSHQFEPSAVLEESIRVKFKNEFNQKWKEQKEKQDSEIRKKEDQLARQQLALEEAKRRQEAELQKSVEEACKKREETMEKELAGKIAGQFESKMRFLEQNKAEQEEALKEARLRETDFLKKEQTLLLREQELELDKQRAIRDESRRIADASRKQNEEREKELTLAFQLQQKEWEVKFDQQQKALEEARQKAQQGSMQLQGEVQELFIEDLLRQTFPFDVIKEVKKGAFGADCHITIRNGFMQECGLILLESKNTKEFSADWITKLKTDMVAKNAELAILVTKAMPKDMDGFGHREGVYICSLAELKYLVGVLRQGVLKVYEARKSQENKGDKLTMLYDYLTGQEFVGQWNAMRESFQLFRNTLQKERDDFEKSWKKKQKLLDVIISNSMQISGSIEGISGMESMNWSALPEEKSYLLE